MRLNRSIILGSLAGLTLVFLLGAAAYANWVNIPAANSDPAQLKRQGHAKTDLPRALRLTVSETGIAAITAGQVRRANLRFNTFSASELRLTRGGEPVPFFISGSGEAARLYFYAEAVTHTLKAPTVYLLETGDGQQMVVKDAAPTGKGSDVGFHLYRWEENNTILTQTTGDDIWLGPLLLAPRSWELSLGKLHPTGGPGMLWLRVWSSTQGLPEPDHHLEIRVNGRFLTDWYWDGISQETIEIPIRPQTLQQGGPNTLSISAPGDTGAAGEALYIDWIHLVYESTITTSRGQAQFRSSAANIQVNDTQPELLLFDVTTPRQPVLLQNYAYEQDGQATFAGTGTERDYVALTPDQAITPLITAAPIWKDTLRHPERAADYLAIVADVDGFADALQPLLTHRQAQGLQVTAVSLSQVYDEFGHGQQDVDAIRAFLLYAAQHWRTPPRFVLLVGDASYDWTNRHPDDSAHLVPTALVRLSYNGYVASDTWFTLPPDGHSSAAQMAIGRFPVQTVAQLETIVEKTIAYESAPGAGAEWTQNVLLVADDEPRFDELSHNLDAILAEGGYNVHKLHMSENENIRFEIMSVINQGVGLVSYVGHGSARVWGDEMVFQADDAQMLTNQQRLPIFATFTCLNGAFADPDVVSLSETLLWQPGGGVVAAIAPSGRAPVTIAQNTAVFDTFYRAYAGAGVQTLGEALLRAKVELGEPSPAADALHLFNLLGDPALQFHQPAQ